MDFTVFPELTVIRHHTVGEFYNSKLGPIPLTTVIGLRAGVNPVGTEIACQTTRVGEDNGDCYDCYESRTTFLRRLHPDGFIVCGFGVLEKIWEIYI